MAQRRDGQASAERRGASGQRGVDGVGLAAGARPEADGAVREHVQDVQRGRIVAAMVHVATEHGAGNVTVALVVQRAGVSRRTFYELFCDSEQCLLAAIDMALEQVRARVLGAYDTSVPWRVRIRGALSALLCLFDEQPELGRLLVVESLAGGPRALARRTRALEPAIAAVREGQGQSKRAAGMTALTAEGVVGGVLSLVYARIVQVSGRPTGARGPLSALTSELMSMIVLPYLGPGAARRELEIPPPVLQSTSENGQSTGARSDPFKAAGMRMTYRTICVLGAIGAQPGASNRQIGEAAEIADQGQISKLLARLERIGLAFNSNDGHVRGEANVWRLTETGERIVRSLGSSVEGSQSHGARER